MLNLICGYHGAALAFKTYLLIPNHRYDETLPLGRGSPQTAPVLLCKALVEKKSSTTEGKVRIYLLVIKYTSEHNGFGTML